MTEDLDELLDAIDDAKQHARNIVEASTSAHAGFQDATRIVERNRVNDEKDGALRARMAARIADEESLSLAGLADRIGVSRARAHQLKTAGTRPRTEEKTP